MLQGRVATARGNQRKLTHNNEDLAQPKKKKVLNNKKFKNYLPSYNNQNSVVLVEG